MHCQLLPSLQLWLGAGSRQLQSYEQSASALDTRQQCIVKDRG
jgi:hypothetical protein